LLFALSIAALNVQHFLLDHFNNTKPGPEDGTEASFLFLAFAYKVCLVTLALAVLLDHKPKASAMRMGYLILTWIFFRHVPLVITNVTDPGEMNSMCMGIALAGGAFIVADSYTDRLITRRSYFLFNRSSQINSLGRILFGLPMIVFGMQHLFYAEFIASQIPAWITGKYFWANATGIALIAAGISIVFGVKSKWSALCLGNMIALWIVILHLPRLFASPKDMFEWTSLFQSLAICAGAFAMREGLRRKIRTDEQAAKILIPESSRRTPSYKKRLKPRKPQVKTFSG